MSDNGRGQPVVALDIDGTLGDYHGHFLQFAEGWTGRTMPDPKRINPGMQLHRFMGLRIERYRECKLAYRQGGLKRTMPAYRGAGLLTQSIRQAGAQVWICTHRPFMRLDNIDPDTREWLRRNGIQYDGVIFDPLNGGSKYAELKRQVGSRVAAVVDDLPEMCWEAKRHWHPSIIGLRNQPYNQHVPNSDGFTRLYDCNEIWMFVAEAILRWKEWEARVQQGG